MYAYLYDAYLRSPKYDRVLAKIETRLFGLGLQGKTEKLTILKSLKELADSALRRGADTVIAVGNDQTFNKLLNILLGKDILLGYIPVDGDNTVAHLLGIPNGVDACDILSARIVQRLDVGKANDAYFLAYCSVDAAQEIYVECNDGRFVLEPITGPHMTCVYNIGSNISNPRDGKVELVVYPAVKKQQEVPFGNRLPASTLIPIRSARIKCLSGSVAGHADGQTVVKTPITISVEPKAMRIIVGKHRVFADER